MTALDTLSNPSGATIPRPASRWLMRFALPMIIVLAAAALLVYAARDALVAATDVEVVQVVTRSGAGDDQASGGGEAAASAEPVVVAQAPGWIEPDPYAVTVQSLASGVIEQVYVLEGQRVAAGEVIARLVDDDAVLAHRQAEAQLMAAEASMARAHSAVSVAEAAVAELRDEIQRKRPLVEIGGISPGEFARLELRLQSRIAQVESAQSEVRQAEAALAQQQVAIDTAKLMLERTVIRAPIDGVVLARWVVPGSRVGMGGDPTGETGMSGIVGLYDPAHLQVRADVPLADAAKVGLGTRARISTEAMADHVFEGEVSRIVHLADIQRNTVEVKVRIENPSPLLKPDMLARVRFLAGESTGDEPEAGEQSGGATSGTMRVFAPIAAVEELGESRGRAWVVVPDERGRGLLVDVRDVLLGSHEGELVHVREGLRPGDRLVLGATEQLAAGARVRIRQENSTTNETEGR